MKEMKGKRNRGISLILVALMVATTVVPTGVFAYGEKEESQIANEETSIKEKAGKETLSSEADLVKIVNNPSGEFVLAKDIEMEGEPLKDVNFKGTLDGNGHVISGITKSLFKAITNATIKNIITEKGMLAETSTDSDIENSGFHIELEDREMDIALIKESNNTKIYGSYVYGNIEGDKVAGFILKGTGEIYNSYVSGRLTGTEVTAFGKDLDIYNSYSSGVLVGAKTSIFGNGKIEESFYDSQANNLSEEKGKGLTTKELTSGELKNKEFKETRGGYPKIKGIDVMKEKGQKISSISIKAGISLRTLSGPRIGGTIEAGESTEQETTQITYPTEENKYYKAVLKEAEVPTLPTGHSTALDSDWAIVYWAGTNTAKEIEWNKEYTIYSTDLKTIKVEGSVTTNKRKVVGEIDLEGDYGNGDTVKATVVLDFETKGKLYFERTKDRKIWETISSHDIAKSGESKTYEPVGADTYNYLRARFEVDADESVTGEIAEETEVVKKGTIEKVEIESTGGAMTVGKKLSARLTPSDKQREATFSWHYEANSEIPIATGTNYTVKGKDVGKKIVVVARATPEGDLKGFAKSDETGEVEKITYMAPSKRPEIVKTDDVTATLKMEEEEGLYQFKLKAPGEEHESSIARAKTEATIIGLTPKTTYEVFVKRIGEEGYISSEWSDSLGQLSTTNTRVQGRVDIDGEYIYGEELTAVVSSSVSVQTGKIIWYRLDADNKRTKASEGSVYTLGTEDVGNRLEAAFVGIGEYAGEVSKRTGEVAKALTIAPSSNVTKKEKSETKDSVVLTMPNIAGMEGRRLILGYSQTQEGNPVSYKDKDVAREFNQGEEYTVENLKKDTAYHFVIKFAENQTNQDSEWSLSSGAILAKTKKDTFEGAVEFIYATSGNEPMEGERLTATVDPKDIEFDNRGEWVWVSISPAPGNAETRIYDYGFGNEEKTTTYIDIPRDVLVGTKYRVKYIANHAYAGETEATSKEVVAFVKGKYQPPAKGSISVVSTSDSSLSISVAGLDGQYRFRYKKKGLLTYTEIEKTVYSDIEVLAEGLDRNVEYQFQSMKVEDERGSASDWSEATDVVSTKKTEIAGSVNLSGEGRNGTELTAEYEKANYKPAGDDSGGIWSWYRGEELIAGEVTDRYTLKEQDVNKIIAARYSAQASSDFDGYVEGKTTSVLKKVCSPPTVTQVASIENQATGNWEINFGATKSSQTQKVYYRVQKISEPAPTFPREEQIVSWSEITEDNINVSKDSGGMNFASNGDYTIYLIKTESAATLASNVVPYTFKIGAKAMTGSIEAVSTSNATGDFVVGGTVKAELKNQKTSEGRWKWYISNDAYVNGGTAPSLADSEKWTAITTGFSPTINSPNSELGLTKDMFGKYIKATFTANEENGYAGTLACTNDKYVKEIYDESITITSSTKDGYGKAKAYTNTVITGTVNNYAESGNINRDTVKFKINGTDLITGVKIEGNTFTYTMENSSAYNGKEITAEVSTPKVLELYVDAQLKPLTNGIINSKASTSTSVPYLTGVPISTPDNLEKFMQAVGNYTDRGENSVYIITDNINMSSNPTIDVSYTPFKGTLDGDFHTIVGIKNVIFQNLGGGTKIANVRNLCFSNVNIVGDGKISLLYSGASKTKFSKIMIINAAISSKGDAGFLGGFSDGITVEKCLVAGGTVDMESVGDQSMGGLVGYMRNGSTMQNCFAINTALSTNKSSNRMGTLLGCTKPNNSGNDDIQNNYAAGKIEAADGVGRYTGGVIGELQAMPRENSNNFYDKTIAPADYLDDNSTVESSRGTGKETKEMIGVGLQRSFDAAGTAGIWSYKEGYYPQLAWTKDIKNANSIVNLYTATRGAFVSIDKETKSDDLFNGDISGTIQLPNELLTKDYTVTSSNEGALKIGDNGTIIPVGAVGEKATISITYKEPDETIGGTASNTYDFTVKKQVKEMGKAKIVDSKNQEIDTENPYISETLNAVIEEEGAEPLSYQWYKRSGEGQAVETIVGATNKEYQVKAEDIGKELTVRVMAIGYSASMSKYTKEVVAKAPQEGPEISEITDRSVRVQMSTGESGLFYEFGYKKAAEPTKNIQVVKGKHEGNDVVEIDRLARNTEYDFYVRIAGAVDGSSKASEWSPATSRTLEKTALEGNVIIGPNINTGTEVSLSIETINGQSGKWKIERVQVIGGAAETVVEELASGNEVKYLLTNEDIGKRIRATFVATGNFKGSKTGMTQVVKRAFTPDVPNAPTVVSKTNNTITVKAEGSATTNYDVGYMEGSAGDIKVGVYEISGGKQTTITELKRNTQYSIYARTSETEGKEASFWSLAKVTTTDKENVAGGISITGADKLETESNIKFVASEGDRQTGRWKLERYDGNTYSTISPSGYTVSDDTRSLEYQIKPTDASDEGKETKLRATFTGIDSFSGSMEKETGKISKKKQTTEGLSPAMVSTSGRTDKQLTVKATRGNDTYQFGYTKKGEDVGELVEVEGSVDAEKEIRINELARNKEYEIYVRKAARTGYEPSEFVKTITAATDKTALRGRMTYTAKDNNDQAVDNIQVGTAHINYTYEAVYTPDEEETQGLGTGTYQWYKDEVAIEGANQKTYKVMPMEGTPEITVRYIADANGDYKDYVKATIGTLTKTVGATPSLPIGEALAEDGEKGSKIEYKIQENANTKDVYWYVQKASNTKIPVLVPAISAELNEQGEDKWFKAVNNLTLTLDPHTEYILYAAVLETPNISPSAVISKRAVKTVREDIERVGFKLIEEGTDTMWKVLQNKKLKVDAKGTTGSWQYYVAKDKSDPKGWINVNSDIRYKLEEGTEEGHEYTSFQIPLKYLGYYVKVEYEGTRGYTEKIEKESADRLSGTQIKGQAEVISGNDVEVLTPIEVKYSNGAVDVDEPNGHWTWHKETEVGSNNFETIKNADGSDYGAVGVIDNYTPTGEDVDKKIFAQYNAQSTGIYTGMVSTSTLNSVAKAVQNKPDAPTLRLVRGTDIQVILPTNYRTDGTTVPDVTLGYKLKNSAEEVRWLQKNSSWIKDNLTANTDYEIYARYESTAEYRVSEEGYLLEVKTGNKPFEKSHLAIVSISQDAEGKLIAKFTGPGYDEGYFMVLRSDNTVGADKIEGTKGEGNTITMEYALSSADISNNMIVRYIAKDDAKNYGGYVEKSTAVVGKPATTEVALKPELKTVKYSETTLTAEVKNKYEYQLTEGQDVPAANAWEKLVTEEAGKYIFRELDKDKTYYLHARVAETAERATGTNSTLSVGEKPWARSTYNIKYNLDGGINNKENPVTYTELSETFNIKEPSKKGFTFIGWTYAGVTEAMKNPSIEKYSEVNKEFTAVWERNSYSIQFNGNGGTSDIEEQSVEYEGLVGVPAADPVRTGYTFTDWYKESACTNQWDFTTEKVIESTILYAGWKTNEYKLNLDANGGTPNISTPITKNFGDKWGTLPVVTKKGYTFEGWFETDAGGTITVTKITADTKVTASNISAKAKWKLVEYRITYDMNGGINPASNPVKYTVESENIALNAPTKAGYTFAGWTGSNGDAPQTDVTIAKGETGAKAYTANFDAINYGITYYMNGGINHASNPVKYTVESEKIALNAPTKAGYTFAGWTGSNGDAPQTDVTIAKGETGDKEYTANWNVNSYKLNFNADGGTPNISTPITKNFGDNWGTLPVVTKIGYRFEGWFETDAGGEITATKITEDSLVPAKDVSAIAKWKLVEYRITYDMNGGINHASNPVKYTVESEKIALNAPTKAGYTFAGWTGSNGDAPQTDVTIAKGETGAKAYTANFTKDPIKPANPGNSEKDNAGGIVPGKNSTENGQDINDDGNVIRVGKGGVRVDIVGKGNLADTTKFVYAVLTKEQLKKVRAGGSIHIVLKVKEGKKAKKLAKNKAKSERRIKDKAKSEKLKIGVFYDVKVWVDEGTGWYKVSKLNNKIDLVLNIPDDLIGKRKEYVMLHDHQGVVKVLKDIDKSDETVSSKTKDFSTYAIGYDKKPIWPWILAACILIAGIIVLIKRRKSEAEDE